ncbi:MAG: PmoA family protein [Armatimonadota bacterium]
MERKCVMLLASLASLVVWPCVPAFADSPFGWVDEDGALKLLCNDRPVLQYNYGVVEPPEGVGRAFARNAYMHPVWNPAGRVVSGDFPRDHYHQRGVFFAWVKTEFGDLHPDFWNLGKLTGRIWFQQLPIRFAEEEAAGFVAEHQWQARRGEEWVPVLNETWRVTVHAPQEDQPEHWVFDLTSEQECATDTPLVLPQHYYGGMCYRGHDDWIDAREAVWALTSEGRQRAEANETNARWCCMGGPLEGGWGGVTIMDHPRNPRHPNRVRVHPRYPFFIYVLPQAESYTIEPGERLVLRYRFLIHSRQPDAAALEQAWQEFAGSTAPE